MAYSAEVDNGMDRRWILEFTHNSTDVSIWCQVLPKGNGSEAQRDAVFQAFLDKVATLQGITITTRKKYTMYEQEVTVTP